MIARRSLARDILLSVCADVLCAKTLRKGILQQNSHGSVLTMLLVKGRTFGGMMCGNGPRAHEMTPVLKFMPVIPTGGGCSLVLVLLFVYSYVFFTFSASFL